MHVHVVAERSQRPAAKDPAHHRHVAWWREVTFLRCWVAAATGHCAHPAPQHSRRFVSSTYSSFRLFHDCPLPGHCWSGPHRDRKWSFCWTDRHGKAEVNDDAAAARRLEMFVSTSSSLFHSPSLFQQFNRSCCAVAWSDAEILLLQLRRCEIWTAMLWDSVYFSFDQIFH